MKRAVVWSNAARDDYSAITRFIARENPGAASKVADRIDTAVGALGQSATGRAGRVSGTYEKVVARLPYIVAYEILARQSGEEVVVILHVIHAACNWPAGRWPKPW